MKRHGIFMLAMAMALVSCARSGGSPPGTGPVIAACGSGFEVEQGIVQTQELSPSSLDPYWRFGKVQLNGDIERRSQKSSTSVAIQSAEAILPAGYELSVSLADSCLTTGEISESVRRDLDKPWLSPSPSGVHSYTWRLTSPMTSAELRVRAERDSCVIGISESVLAQTSETLNDPLISQQDHLKMLGVTDSSSVMALIERVGIKPVTIAIIDTGIDMNHEDLRDVLWRNPGEIASNSIDDDKNGYVDDVNGYNFALHKPSPQYISTVTGYQHGTHVAGLAAAKGGNGVGGAGVMTSHARIMMLNVFGKSNAGAYTSDIVNAIRYAADNGADIINMSLGGIGKSAEYESAIAYAVRKGVVVLAAAGNEHLEIGPEHFMSPAGYGHEFEGMIAVGSVDSESGLLSSYSNFSTNYVELAAPGAEDARSRRGLLSTWPGNKYARIQGTSMSTPVAAGAAAAAISMLRARGYAPSPKTIERILSTSASVKPELSGYIEGARSLNFKALAGS